MSAISTIIPSGDELTIQCYYKYNNDKFSCKLELGSISKFFTGFLSGSVWVIKQANEFFDETGSPIAFAEKSLQAFTDSAIQTTTNDIKNGLITVPGYTNEGAN